MSDYYYSGNHCLSLWCCIKQFITIMTYYIFKIDSHSRATYGTLWWIDEVIIFHVPPSYSNIKCVPEDACCCWILFCHFQTFFIVVLLHSFELLLLMLMVRICRELQNDNCRCCLWQVLTNVLYLYSAQLRSYTGCQFST